MLSAVKSVTDKDLILCYFCIQQIRRYAAITVVCLFVSHRRLLHINDGANAPWKK